MACASSLMWCSFLLQLSNILGISKSNFLFVHLSALSHYVNLQDRVFHTDISGTKRQSYCSSQLAICDVSDKIQRKVIQILEQQIVLKLLKLGS